MYCSIVAEFHWTPDYLDTMFLDDEDEFGVLLWYKVIQELAFENSKTDNE